MEAGGIGPVARPPGRVLDPWKIENGTPIDLASIDRRKNAGTHVAVMPKG